MLRDLKVNALANYKINEFKGNVKSSTLIGKESKLFFLDVWSSGW
jgi:hypothetical protein